MQGSITSVITGGAMNKYRYIKIKEIEMETLIIILKVCLNFELNQGKFRVRDIVKKLKILLKYSS